MVQNLKRTLCPVVCNGQFPIRNKIFPSYLRKEEESSKPQTPTQAGGHEHKPLPNVTSSFSCIYDNICLASDRSPIHFPSNNLCSFIFPSLDASHPATVLDFTKILTPWNGENRRSRGYDVILSHNPELHKRPLLSVPWPDVSGPDPESFL
jgi:hypothetical protein